MMNSQFGLRRLLCNYHRAIQCKRYEADKLLGISYSSRRDFAKKVEPYRTPTLNDTQPLEDYKTQYERNNKKYTLALILGVGSLVVSAYVLLKSGMLRFNMGPNFETFNPEPREGAKIFFTEEELAKKNKENAKTAADLEEDEEVVAPVFPDVKIPEKVPYLIIGAGTSSVSAFRAIKARDPTAKVLLISAEGHNPYMRPPLSKEFWYSDDIDLTNKFSFKQWNGKERSIFFEHEEYYEPIDKLMENENGGISVVYGKRAVKIDATNRLAYLNDGTEIKYEKCLIATGGKPKSLPVFDNAPKDVRNKTTLFRNVADFQRLHKVVEKGKRVAVIGGGFLGSELACSLGFKAKTGKGSVIQIYPENGNMSKVLPEYLSEWSTQRVRNEGVEIVSNSYIKSATAAPGGKVKLLLNSKEEYIVDHVVIAVGLEPNIELAISSGLELDENHGGFRVNAELEARSNLWVAGDAACFYDMKLGRRRVEHHDHAVVSGRLAGENMSGAGKPYWHQSMFWSDLGPEVGYEAIGIVDSSLNTVGVFAKATKEDTPKAVVEATGENLRSETETTTTELVVESAPKKVAAEKEVLSEELSSSKLFNYESESLHQPITGEDYGKGIIFYLRDNIVVGLVLWNVYSKMPIARRVIKEAKVYDDLNELAKLFNLHEE